jgi:hypothetical protein
LTGSASTAASENSSLHGRPFSRHLRAQSRAHSSRNNGVNAPRYAITPELRRTSPVSFVYSLPYISALLVHRAFSPPRPETSCVARSILRAHRSTSHSSLCFLACCSRRFASRAASLSSTYSEQKSAIRTGV